MQSVKKIRKCLFPVAGYGTRFLPATKAMPKEMLPVVNKPLIQYGVEEAIEAGVTEVGFITGRGKRAIADHFDTSYELEHQIRGTSKEKHLEDIREVMDTCNFIFMRQREMLGLGHAILTGQPIIGDEPFAVILADDLCARTDEDVSKRALGQLVEVYEKYNCSVIAIEEVPGDNISSYGVISGREIEDGLFEVDDMVEKPKPEDAPSQLGIIGRYVLTPDIFEYIEKTAPGANGEVQITDAIRTLAKEKRVLALKFKGHRFDCGSIDGFVEATNYYYQRDHAKK
ncbi:MULTISPECIES: UTP--glucose-1-phosphate uridylyltransferase GalU [Methylophaga]|jgi:UTP--glucose-1-phosphate uridylyltransferase|uniref:UTP--glucose-1-phosphate uridylyltransferase n=1 Tax=Methylophaga marina TaxID=45495 RepID=A0ABN0T8W8_9GAMM|nr:MULTISPECIES: UTP--glucose-1-phosphate uridylyltransferase GalU [unclassified Methylophaga]MAX53408.1 UTP--glucose-1-phosphate uridylyltransferase [Methylophaga sp.]|tara:strand:+ start:1986 stop:2840 length:855 start_codon:yes stop_codon:yes gene_type:complete